MGATPSLMRVYGLKPWDLHRLTGHELAALVDDFRAMTKAVSDG